MTGAEAIEWIHGQYGLGKKDGLENSEALLARLRNPHRAYPCIHVAGTNGKGSICAMLSSILTACGYRTGLYTSPYLERFNERMRVDGEPIPDDDLGEVASHVRENVEALARKGIKATVFEIGTACAFEYFHRAQVDVAVIEVGLGGRLDPTNVIQPALSVIANIGMDHESILGATLEAIAGEKAGIIKKGAPCVLYPQDGVALKVIQDVCEERETELIEAAGVEFSRLESDISGHTFSSNYRGLELSNVRLNLPGAHQVDNARTVIAALSALREAGFLLGESAIARGFAGARWAGRLEWRGNVLLDGAHNEQSASMLADYAREYLRGKKTVAVCGIQRGKAAARIVRALAPALDEAYCVTIKGHREGNPEELAALFRAEGVEAGAYSNVESALASARGAVGGDGVVMVCGSLYLVGTVREMLA